MTDRCESVKRLLNRLSSRRGKSDVFPVPAQTVRGTDPGPRVTTDWQITGRRLILATIVAATAGALAFDPGRAGTSGKAASDFAQVWAAAKGWRQGMDPYQVVGPGRPFDWHFPVAYPLPAVILGLPFSMLPLHWADACFVALETWVFVWALTRARLRNPAVISLLSLSFIYVIQTAQWSPLIVAAALLPAAAPLWVCKPTIGAALVIARPRRWTIASGCLLVGISVLVWPSWPWEWRHNASALSHVVPIITQTAVGPLVLLALARWRRADARLLVAMGCMPQTSLLYEAIPLFLVAGTYFEAAALAVLTYVAWVLWYWSGPFPSYEAGIVASGRMMVWCLYLPCTAFVLRKPNVWTDFPALSRAA